MLDALPNWRNLTTEERATACKALIADGMSASQMAKRFRNCSRSAIIGLCNRQKITMAYPSGPFAINVVKPARSARPAKPKLVRPALPRIEPYDVEDNPDAPDVTHLIGIMDLKPGHCRFIHGDPMGRHGYCGEQTLQASSWCAEHHRIVFPGGKS